MADVSEEVNTLEKRLNAIIENLEDKSKELMGRVRNDVLPQAEATVRDNLWSSLFAALGVGLILGLVIGFGSGRR